MGWRLPAGVMVGVALAAGGGVPALWGRPPVLLPTPIGAGAAYRPQPRGPLARGTVFRCQPASLRGRSRFLEVFANRRVVVVAAGIGVEEVRRRSFGRIGAAHCRLPLWTLEPTGVVRFDRVGLRLGDLFAIWRQPFSPTRLLSFRARAGQRLLVFRNGRRLRLPPAGLLLHDRDEIVLELNGYLPPHRAYLFPPERAGGAISSGRLKGP